MALTEMNIIKQAEEESARSLAQANLKKGEIEAEANRRINECAEKSRAEIAGYQALLVKKYDEYFAKFQQEFSDSLEKEAAALRSSVTEKKDEVVAFILKEVVKYGN